MSPAPSMKEFAKIFNKSIALLFCIIVVLTLGNLGCLFFSRKGLLILVLIGIVGSVIIMNNDTAKEKIVALVGKTADKLHEKNLI